MSHAPVFLDIILLLAVSIPAILLFRRLRLPAIAGFLAVGVLVGPNGLGWVEQTEQVESLAELGIVLLLFTIGLEFSLPRVFLHGRRMLLGGGGQVLATCAVLALAAVAFGLSWRSAILVGFLGALSSTAFVAPA